MGVRGQHAALELAGSVGAHDDRRQEEEGGPLLMEEVMGQERRMKGDEHTCKECGIVKTGLKLTGSEVSVQLHVDRNSGKRTEE